MEFHERLRKYRLEKNLSQEELGLKCGVSTRTIQVFESGKRYPKLQVIMTMADVLEVSASDLMGNTASENNDSDMSAMDHAEKLCAMMAGGELPAEDKDAILRMVTLAYTHSMETNKVKARASRKKKAD